MTIKEAYNHDWKEGETVWAVIHKYYSIPEQDSYGALPVGVKEITVKKAKRNTYCNTTFLKIEFDTNNKKCTCWDDYLGVDYNHDFCNLSHNTDKLCCDFKFFDKESAEKEFARQTKEFGIYLKNCKNAIKRQIEENKKELKKLEHESSRLLKSMNKITQQIKDYDTVK